MGGKKGQERERKARDEREEIYMHQLENCITAESSNSSEVEGEGVGGYTGITARVRASVKVTIRGYSYNMTVSTVSSKVVILLRPNFV